MTRPWIFLINPFISATANSYRKMKQIGDYTLSALAAAAVKPGAPAALNDLLAELSPLVETYDNAYNTWLSLHGVQKGQTQSLKDLLANLAGEVIQEWDLAIQNVYRQHTTQYMALLPHRRQPFQNGSQQSRISAVGALALAIGDDAALQTLKTQVNSVYDALTQANFAQKGSKSNKSGSSDELEFDRIALGAGLYGVLGALMHLFKEAPEVIASYFLIEELRNIEQTIFRHEIKGDETLLAFVRSFEDGEQLKLINRNNTALKIARVPKKTDAMPEAAFTLPANQEQTVLPDALGDKANRFLIVKNMSATEKGAFTIEII